MKCLLLTALVLFTTVPLAAADCPPLPTVDPKEPTKPLDPRKQFIVSFQGIVCVADCSARNEPGNTAARCDERRAIVVQGDTMHMRHNPRLFVPSTVKKSELTAASGRPAFCDADVCWVELDDVDIRIRDVNKDKPLPLPGSSSVCIDKTFCDFVPHLRDDPAIRGTLRSGLLDRDALPVDPTAAFFEIESGGALTACAFRNKGTFVDANGQRVGACRPFAEEVWWQGVTAEAAVLEMRSQATANRWQSVDLGNGDPGNPRPLWMRIETVSTARRTPEHFALHKKLLFNTAFPSIDIDACDMDVMNNLDYLCTSAEIEVPGCSDTGYPQ